MHESAPIGIIGLGLMGAALSERLIEAGAPLIGFDIDPARCERLQAGGGAVTASVRELAGRTRTIVIAVYSGAQAEALFGEIEGGTTSQPSTVVCMTTCAPDEIARLSERAAGAGIAL